MALQFVTRKYELSDRSEVFDLVAKVDDEFHSVWAAPSVRSAESSAAVFNSVFEGFQLCGSDNQVLRLEAAINAALAEVLDE